MFAPSHNPYFYQHQDKPVSPLFSLLCWNIHKENLQSDFRLALEKLLHAYPSDFLLFQEYKMPKYQPPVSKAFSYAMAANIETKRNLYGLLSASCFGFDARQIELSRHKEFLITTQKSMLLTRHRFADGKVLHLINMHAVNFVSLKAFKQVLKSLYLLLQTYEGAMIVGGDFNNWSKRRLHALAGFTELLALNQAVIEEAQNIKLIFAKPIDHIFYRGVELIKAEAIDTKKVSDHNPIHAIFKIL